MEASITWHVQEILLPVTPKHVQHPIPSLHLSHYHYHLPPGWFQLLITQSPCFYNTVCSLNSSQDNPFETFDIVTPLQEALPVPSNLTRIKAKVLKMALESAPHPQAPNRILYSPLCSLAPHEAGSLLSLKHTKQVYKSRTISYCGYLCL